jgi:hypothetical protein
VKNRYIFLIVSLILIGTFTYYLDSHKEENKFIVETEGEIISLSKEKDSIFYLVDEVLTHIDDKKRGDSLKLYTLDEKVKTKQITIEEQVLELKSLVKVSNDMKEWAETERDKAVAVERLSIQQKMVSERARMEVLYHLDSLKKVNLDLNEKYSSIEKENIRLQSDIKNLILKFNVLENTEVEEDYKNKKRKKGK